MEDYQKVNDKEHNDIKAEIQLSSPILVAGENPKILDINKCPNCILLRGY